MLLYGTDNLTKLGVQWGILEPGKKTEEENEIVKKKRKEARKTQEEILEFFNRPIRCSKK